MLADQKTTSKQKKFNVLYVDDEETNLRIFQISFRKDYNIFTAINGEDAIEVMNNHEIDLIITDQQMPQMTGLDLLRKIIPTNPGVLRMIMTGFTDTSALIEAVNEVGIHKYIKKPWSRDILKETLDNELQQYLTEKGISNAEDKEDNHIEVKETLDFVQKSFLKNEAEIKEIFNTSFLINFGKKPVGEVYWAGFIGGRNVFCKVGVNAQTNSTGIFLNGVYATMCDRLYSLSDDQIGASEIYKIIQDSLVGRGYDDFAKKLSSDGLSIFCLVQDAKTIGIKSSGVNALIKKQSGDQVWISDQTDLTILPEERVVIISKNMTSFKSKEQNFKEIMEESSNSVLKDQKNQIKTAVELWGNESPLVDGLSIFGFEFNTQA